MNLSVARQTGPAEIARVGESPETREIVKRSKVSCCRTLVTFAVFQPISSAPRAAGEMERGQFSPRRKAAAEYRCTKIDLETYIRRSICYILLFNRRARG